MPILMSDIAAGSKAVEEMGQSGDRDVLSKATASSAQSEALLKGLRAMGQQKYMASQTAKTSSPSNILNKAVVGNESSGLDDPTTSGGRVFNNMTSVSQLQQEKAELRQEQENQKNLTPEDRFHLENSIVRRQNSIDRTELKLLAEANKTLGTNYALADSVNSEASLQGAREYRTKEASTMVDAAISAGKLKEEDRASAIKMHVNQLLPERYDDAGKAMLAANTKGLLSVKEQAEEKRIQIQANALAVTAQRDREKFQSDMMKATRDSNRDSTSASRNLLRDQISNLKNTREEGTKKIRALQDAIKEDNKIPPKELTGFPGFRKENPNFTSFTSLQKARQEEIDSLTERDNTAADHQAVLAERLASIGTDIGESKTTTKTSSKTSYSSAIDGKSYEEVMTAYKEKNPNMSDDALIKLAKKQKRIK